MKSILLRLLFLPAALLLTTARAVMVAPDPIADAERKAVLTVVQKFFDAMEAHDGESLRALLLVEGQSFSTREEAGKFVLRNRALGDFATRLSTMTDKLLERMWDPTVLVHDRIATVWTPYDFHLNGKYSHGGIDIFN